MQLLTIETTGASASVALSDQAGNRILETSSERMNHLQNLMTMIQSVLKKRSLQISDVTAIAVSEGPGSFTGIRIGVSAARALAQALSLPVIPVPTLQSFVYQEPSGENFIVSPLFDARRSQVYAGPYRLADPAEKEDHSSNGGILPVVEGKAWDVREYLTRLAEQADREVRFYGDGTGVYEKEIQECVETLAGRGIRGSIGEPENRFQRADSVSKLGMELMNAGKKVNYGQVKPVYMRKAEAERKLEEACQK